MPSFITRYWWLFLLRGIAAVLLGLLALWTPGVTFTVLVFLLGAYMFIDGIFSVVTFINKRNTIRYRGWHIASGIMGIIIGILTFINPFATGIALVYLVAFWALLTGIAGIAIAIWLRREIKGEGWYIAGGVLSILFGVLILFNPLAGALTLTFIFGVYALMAGIILIFLSVRLKKRYGSRELPSSLYSS